jgi:hypothetical protein
LILPLLLNRTEGKHHRKLGMNSFTVAFAVAAITFAGGMAGLILQKWLPEDYHSQGDRDAIQSVVGLITLLLALVLGLLTASAYGIFTAQKTAVQNFASEVRRLDLALDDYGPGADAARATLRKEVSRTLEQFWGKSDVDFVSRNYNAAISNLHERKVALDALQPTTEAQKQALSSARDLSASVGQTRLQAALQLDDTVSLPLLIVVTSWAFILFIGFGLLSRIDGLAVSSLAFGALAVASAVFLIADLSSPFSGYFQISPLPVQRVLQDLGK